MEYLDLPGKMSMHYYDRLLKVSPGGLKEDAFEKLRATAPFIVSSASGSYLYDVDGNRYIDFMSGWATNNLGNANPEIIEVVVEALNRFGFVYNHTLAIELAEKLVEITPGNLTRVSFEVSGTEAAEAAVSYALTHTKRPLIISFIGQFHGDSIGARNLGSETAKRRSYFEAMHGGVIHVPYPRNTRIPKGMDQEDFSEFILWYIDDHILEYVAEPDRIAGILFEPIMAEGGNYIPPKSFFHKLRRLADMYGWLLLDDEVLTGFGRTGRMWAIEYYNIDVDVLVCGKGLTGGLIPIGAVIGSEEVMGITKAYSGSTFAGNPAGCAAALKTIEIMYRDNILDRVSRLGEEALKVMSEWVDKYRLLCDARGIGFLLGFEVETGKGLKVDEYVAKLIYLETAKYGVRTIWDNEPTVRIYPPLTIEEEALFEGLDRVEMAIRKVESEYGN